MKSILLLITAALTCVACAGERPAEAANPAAPAPAATSAPDVPPASPGTVTDVRTPAAPAPATTGVAPTAAPATTPVPPAAAAAPRPEALRITPDELRPMLDAGEAILVDVRGEMDFAFRHAEGAVHIPAQELFARSVELPHEKLIALYCT